MYSFTAKICFGNFKFLVSGIYHFDDLKQDKETSPSDRERCKV